MSISVVIITLNEEDNIDSCLETVKWADEVIVVDGGSKDRTVEKARRFGAKTYEIPFRDFSSQKNAALEKATGDWIFLVDADERVTSDLAREIQKVVEKGERRQAFALGRKTYFFGKHLRFSATQDDYPIRLWPRGRVHFEQPVHEEAVTDLEKGILKHPLIHYSTRNLEHYRLKLRRYLPLEVRLLNRRRKESSLSDLILRPLGKFAHLYFWRGGILDGLAGLQFALLSSLYVFLKYSRFRKHLKENGKVDVASVSS